MAIQKIGSKWCTDLGTSRHQFIMDSVDDVPDLPKCCPGSTAVVADSSREVYMVNASGTWVNIGTASYNLAEGVSF